MRGSDVILARRYYPFSVLNIEMVRMLYTQMPQRHIVELSQAGRILGKLVGVMLLIDLHALSLVLLFSPS